MKNNKETLRKCIGCQEIFNKKDLLRIVKINDEEFKVDFSGKLNGRGAYICKNLECLEKAIKNRGLERSFKMKVPCDIVEMLKKEFNDGK